MSIDDVDLPGVILLLATLILVPLGVSFIERMTEDSFTKRALRGLKWAGFPAALSLAASFLIPPSPIAAALALPWMLVTWGLAGVGLLHVVRRWRAIDTALGADLALMMLSIGGTWAVMYRLGRWPGGFEPIIAELTAVHFHYAGFVLPLVASQIANQRDNWLTRSLAPVVCLAALLLALGITLSPAVELIASLLWRVAQPLPQSAARWLLRLAGTSLAAGAALALLYAPGEFTGDRWIDIPRMIPLHGATMALGFALPALLGFTLHARRKED